MRRPVTSNVSKPQFLICERRMIRGPTSKVWSEEWGENITVKPSAPWLAMGKGQLFLLTQPPFMGPVTCQAYRTVTKRNKDTVLSYQPLCLSGELRKSMGVIFYAVRCCMGVGDGFAVSQDCGWMQVWSGVAQRVLKGTLDGLASKKSCDLAESLLSPIL